jgi:hypothetical protein
MKEKSFLIFVWCHLWNAGVSLEGADTTSYTTYPKIYVYTHTHTQLIIGLVIQRSEAGYFVV